MKTFTLNRSTSAIVLIVIGLSSFTQAETLTQLRQDYREAQKKASHIENPKIGTEGFQQKLAIWSQANRQSQETARALIPALLNHWIKQPDDQAIKKEIISVYKALAGGKSTERHNNAKSFLSRAAWPILAQGNLAQEQAELLAQLIKPPGASWINDVLG